MLLAYEATRNLPVERVTIDSWAGPISVDRIKGKKMTIVPILRAGLGMMDGGDGGRCRRVQPPGRAGLRRRRCTSCRSSQAAFFRSGWSRRKRG